MANETAVKPAEDFTTTPEATGEPEAALIKLRKQRTKARRRSMTTKELVAVVPRIDPQANATWGWYLRPDGFRPSDAIVFKPAAAATDREDYERKGFILISNIQGEFGRGSMTIAPPSRATCDEIANELMERRPDFLEHIQQEINANQELAESGKPDWRRTYLMKVRQLEAIQKRCQKLEITGAHLEAFFTTVHHIQVANRVPESFRQMQNAAAEEAKWAGLAAAMAGALEELDNK